MKTEQTMNITCDCGERSPRLRFECDKGVGWQCLMCGRRHLFHLERKRFGYIYDDWREVKRWTIHVNYLVYAPFMDGVQMNYLDVLAWRKRASYQEPELCKPPKAEPPPKPPAKEFHTSQWITHGEHWKATRENRRRLFLRRSEDSGLGLALASFDFKNRLIQKLTLRDEIEALFSESSHLRGVRDAAAREIRRYQRL